jgi:hypothetical protein
MSAGDWVEGRVKFKYSLTPSVLLLKWRMVIATFIVNAVIFSGDAIIVDQSVLL